MWNNLPLPSSGSPGSRGLFWRCRKTALSKHWYMFINLNVSYWRRLEFFHQHCCAILKPCIYMYVYKNTHHLSYLCCWFYATRVHNWQIHKTMRQITVKSREFGVLGTKKSGFNCTILNYLTLQVHAYLLCGWLAGPGVVL